MPFDVRDETARAEKSEDSLKVLNFEKMFGRYKAVDNVTFDVDGGEKLALLGPNGAGKTTTLSLIRGHLRPSSRMSDVLISGLSIRKDQLAAPWLLGVCPQFNTVNLMTVHEHLAFYARARGVPDIYSNVLKVMDAVGLMLCRRRMTGKLSGNQRKLSLATAIIGNPSVLLLDELSTRMDVVAMRVVWKAVRAICAGRVIIITTHSMEEASTLSDRTAIVDQSLLLTADTTSELTKRHGAGIYHVHIVLANGLASAAEEMQKVRDWVPIRFEGATMHDRLFPDIRGQLRFQITNTSTGASSSKPSKSGGNELEDELKSRGDDVAAVTEGSVSTTAGDQLVNMLDALGSEKERLSIGYYTVKQATLEDVFLDVISRNRAL